MSERIEIWYHGTSGEHAASIRRTGFRIGTHFARTCRAARRYGTHVFAVALASALISEDAEDQLHAAVHIPPSAIRGESSTREES